MNEILKNIFMETLSNLVWVGLVFVIIYFRDRKKKGQIEFCLQSYLAYLAKSVALVKNCVYPYIYLVDTKVIQGTILSTLQTSIYQLCNNISDQTQDALSMVENRDLQQKILKLHHRIALFQAHISESQIATDLIVGNPAELVEPPRGTEEINIARTFVLEFENEVRDIYQSFPQKIKEKVPQDILSIMDQKMPLQERYEQP